MKRRDVEETHSFSAQIARECGIYELGGLLLNAQDQFTAAVEAYEADEAEVKEKRHFLDLLREYGYYENTCMECVLAQALGVPFYIFFKIHERPQIYQYQIAIDTSADEPSLTAVSYDRISPSDFLAWWQQYKQTKQTKDYRPQFQDRAADSYFDQLLEGAGLKWGGNIDGFMVSRQGEPAITAVIENRYTNEKSLYSYDPGIYYSADINTWRPLILLRKQLDVPLLLVTYSRRLGEEHLAGLSTVLNEPDETSALRYAQDPMNRMEGRPCGHIANSVESVKKWIATR